MLLHFSSAIFWLVFLKYQHRIQFTSYLYFYEPFPHLASKLCHIGSLDWPKWYIGAILALTRAILAVVFESQNGVSSCLKVKALVGFRVDI